MIKAIHDIYPAEYLEMFDPMYFNSNFFGLVKNAFRRFENILLFLSKIPLKKSARIISMHKNVKKR